MLNQIITLLKSPKCHRCRHRKIVHYDDAGFSGCGVCLECVGFATKEDLIRWEEMRKRREENPQWIYISRKMMELLDKPLGMAGLVEREPIKKIKVTKSKPMTKRNSD